MVKRWIVVAGLVGLAGIVFAAAEEDDAPVPKKEVPEAVLRTGERFAEGGDLERCVRGDRILEEGEKDDED